MPNLGIQSNYRVVGRRYNCRSQVRDRRIASQDLDSEVCSIRLNEANTVTGTLLDGKHLDVWLTVEPV